MIVIAAFALLTASMIGRGHDMAMAIIHGTFTA